MTDDNKPQNPETPSAQNQTAAPAAEQKADVWTQGPEVNQTSSAASAAGDAGSTLGATQDSQWERDVLNRLAFASLNEQRRARRWGIFFKSLVFIYLFAILFYLPTSWDTESLALGKHTALVELNGVIAANSEGSADFLITGLRAAFKDKNTAGIILRINSPGGSPVQAGYVYDEIKRLREKYPQIPLYAVVTDICASGGYYIAAAADEIYADKASIVGSIGVLMDGFGFVDTMKKLGIERRLMTAGEHKAVMDPFSPLKEGEVQHVQNLLNGVHQQFIDKVKEGRGERLADSPDIFSGLFWNGEESVKLGLVDGLGSSSYVARDVIGVENIVDFTPRQNYFDRFADRFGVTMANVLVDVLGLEPASMR